ncbi:Na+/alanine symporter [Clostridium tetanomorphum]|nr:Na+/alanine symporter [Clostridium tetanomorphum]NRS86464.1 Na+/alanine symporter [Clostridium tetanomorphum]NRZ95507.1 Na+/alanine symporter [Clostridium tetanomorphum]SQC00888.1 sodium:alanine symporter family protein [Clostridium tetanomorphum]
MDIVGQIISNINNILWSYVLIAVLIVLGFYFSFRTKFVQLRFFKEMFRLLAERAGNSISGQKSNGVLSFQAFCIGTASRVGTGNLAGVAIAIAVGGPGAVFWMWIIALI